MARLPSMEVLTVRRRVGIGAAIGLLLLVLLLLLRGTAAFERPELALVDARTRYYVGTRAPDPRIVLAVVGEGDLKQMSEVDGPNAAWPWSHYRQSLIVDFLRHAEAKALICDFLFFDRGKSASELDLSPEEMNTVGAQLEAEEKESKLLGAALAKLPHSTVGVYLTDHPTYDAKGRADLAAERCLSMGTSGLPLVRGGTDLPVQAIFGGAARGGFVNVHPDGDGVTRAAYPAADGGRWSWPSLALVGASQLSGRPLRAEHGELYLGDERIQVGPEGRCLVNFRARPEEAYAHVPVFGMLAAGARLESGPEALLDEDRELAARLKDKLVVWGASYAAELDVIAAPISPTFLGPEFHATLIDNYIHGDARVYAPGWVNLFILILCTLGLGIFGAYTRRRYMPHVVALLAIGALLTAGFLLFRGGVAIDLFTPLMGCLLASVASSAFRLMTEGRRNKWLESTFQRYLSPDVIESLKEDPSRLQLGGARRNITIFFSDVAGFTSFTEKLQPDQVVSLLNRYLTGQSEELMGEKAVIDKFEGDAIMAFFGDPLEMVDHPVRACRAAVRCMRALPKLEPVWRELGLEGFDIRIGLNSGPALVGNMGSEARFDYTCMGDSVNLASRLESANKVFGSKIMIGANTYEAAAEHVLAKPLANLVVKGKTEAVPVYELIAMVGDAREGEVDHVGAYRRAHAAVLDDDLAEARRALAEAQALRADDGPCAWLARLIDELETGAQVRPWSGGLVLDHK